MQSELKPCPFCGNGDAPFVIVEDLVWVECGDCSIKWKPSADQAAAAVIRDYGDKRYQQAIADVVEWLTKERLSDTADHYAQLITRRFGKDA